MKLKLKNPQPVPDGASAEAPANGAAQPTPTSTSATSAPKIALKFKQVSAPIAEPAEPPPADAPKPKRKYTKKPKFDENGQPLPAAKPGPKPKKRPLEDGEDGTPAKRKPKPTLKSLALVQESDDEEETAPAPAMRSAPSRPQPARTQSVKISLKPKGPQRTSTAILKVKGGGKPPPRPPGVGYDSEAEEAEIDPAIESQFVLRMQAGPDCDLLRKSIEEKTIGKSQSQGGPGVYFRFFDRDGRKAMITIQGRQYAASMVELPCVIESLKSWNKKDWVKTADVCQMLLVFGRVNSEEEAKKFSRPREVDPDSHRYPHGLTPPMHWVRKRRFRPRKSFQDVERIETHTEALLQDDDNAEESKYELVDSGDESPSEGDASDDEDAEGEDEEMIDAMDYVETPAADFVDEADLEQLLHAELMGGEEVQIEANGGLDELLGDNGGQVEVEAPTSAISHSVAMHAITQNGNVVLEPESAASTPAAATSADDDDDDDGDDDDEVDEEAAEKRAFVDQTKIEIQELEAAIQVNLAKQKASTNIPYKQRMQQIIDKQRKDKEVKMSKIGEAAED